jgi:hypothetical protein
MPPCRRGSGGFIVAMRISGEKLPHEPYIQNSISLTPPPPMVIILHADRDANVDVVRR